MFPEYIILVIIPIFLGFWAQSRVSNAYAKWSKVASRGGLTGAEVADAVMRSAGIDDVRVVDLQKGQCPSDRAIGTGVTSVEIVPISGHLTDHYDPVNKRLSLSSENFYGTSLAALGVAAHESGHAIQDRVGYRAMNLRMSLVPATNFACSLLPFIMFGGFFFHLFGLIYLAVGVYLVLTVFQLVTLPVEFDASHRAIQRLDGLGILSADELVGAKDMLNAAGWTYVAAFVAALGNLLYFLLMISGNRNRN